MTSELTPKGHRLFKVNGKPILIRGGGWASDMMLRPASRERLEAELRYVREMGLNTIRLEGKLESDHFYDLADQLRASWSCPAGAAATSGSTWDKWDAEDHEVAPASLRDQILRLRNHPSVLVWMNGSDFPPPAEVEQAYLDVLKELEWSKPILSSATDAPGPVSGPSGVKMTGPYDYVPPSYWLTDIKNGGAFGFTTEIGPGGGRAAPREPASRCCPPITSGRSTTSGTSTRGATSSRTSSASRTRSRRATARPRASADYARKAQALTYEGQRAMFEAYGRNKYTSTGVIQWMLNNAWPSLIWHLYDYYLRPGGGYFGTKKACEPLHVQYSYDDRSVVVVNDLQTPFCGLKVSAQVFDLGLVSKFSQDGHRGRRRGRRRAGARRARIPTGLSTTYFLRLTARGRGGQRP